MQDSWDADLILFSTEACHLCDIAKSMVIPLAQARQRSLVSVDVSESDPLLERYGIRIPVLQRRSDGAELDWPFDLESLDQFVHPA